MCVITDRKIPNKEAADSRKQLQERVFQFEALVQEVINRARARPKRKTPAERKADADLRC